MKKVLATIILAFIAIALVTLTLPACNDDDDQEPQDNTQRVTIQLSGAQEVPAVNTSATGSANITYDRATKMITYTVSWTLGTTSSTTTGMHFHGAETGSDAASSPVVIPITGFTTANTGTFSGVTRELTDAEVNQLYAGKWYLNIHSDTFPAGELRGNIKFPEGSSPTPAY